jgi:plastocyanin
MRSMHSLLFVLTLAFLIQSRANADTVYVNVMNDFFDPVNVTLNVGDFITWTLVEGVHTTTSTAIPPGAAAWNYTFTSISDTYTYEVTVPGDYDYVCLLHPGMDGFFTAEIPLNSLPFIEEFDYPAGNLLTDHGWTNHSGTGQFITIASGNLTYTGYPSSGIGNHVVIEGGASSREDVNAGFDSLHSDGDVLYYAFLANAASASATADYFIHIGNRVSPTAFTSFSARVFVQDVGGALRFGLSNTSTATMGTTDFSYGTTYLVIVKYTINISGADETKMWVLSSGVPPDEASAGTPEVTNTTTSGQDIIDAIALRQGGQAYSVQVDGIRVGTTWFETVVPVELVSFAASVSGSSVLLNWVTASEINNSGFEVERKSLNSSWQKIGFVQGNGTTTETKYYSYSDNNLTPGQYSYRLKQIDYDGTFAYSSEVLAEIDVPLNFELLQNYPNPFNPATSITFSIPQTQHVTLKVFNALGQEIKTLVNGIREAGSHRIDFDASGLYSGIYFYRIDADDFSQVKKMTLIK